MWVTVHCSFKARADSGDAWKNAKHAKWDGPRERTRCVTMTAITYWIPWTF